MQRRHEDQDAHDDRGRREEGHGEPRAVTAVGAAVQREGVDHALGPVGGDGDLLGGAAEEFFEPRLVDHVDHGVVTSAFGAYGARRSSAASRRRASCRRDLTVPGRRRIAVAISRSLRSE